eukprot:TRINITY_DN7932_c0_g2_i1.p1 TRINITY_DN7932_c0_g2~~TRINITY_DN7932_c0_g2_i1.p1  ORF type:complete len:677 (+),score=95.96 TRINITY_DN7932_c0_g2_i1:39-2033(+)
MAARRLRSRRRALAVAAVTQATAGAAFIDEAVATTPTPKSELAIQPRPPSSSNHFPQVSWGNGVETPLVAPGILDCTYNNEWNRFREAFQENAKNGFQFENELFNMADTLIAKNLFSFLEFHRSKSNEFFHDCDRDVPRGVVCLYGMLSAFFIHHLYLRYRIEVLQDFDDDDLEVFSNSTALARHMLINKNNCLDFFESSGWPLTVGILVEILRPPGADAVPSVPDIPKPPPPWPSLHARLPELTSKIVVHISGTHAALAREPAEMLVRFVGSLLQCTFEVVLEVADETHCGFVGCNTREDTQEADGDFSLGLRNLAVQHFRPRWNGLEIVGFEYLMEALTHRLRAASFMRKEVDIFTCTSPAILCLPLLSLDKPILAYLGEPLLLSVPAKEVTTWWRNFETLVLRKNSMVACYNPFLRAMIEHQTGLSLPVIRMHGLYTDALYDPVRVREVLVIRGPNICVDSGCMLNRFVRLLAESASSMENSAELIFPSFYEKDELGGASYRTLGSFQATVLYPYFYELYSMGMPMFLPHVELLPFYVFRGLHSSNDYHHVSPGVLGNGNGSTFRVSSQPPPFLGALDIDSWFVAGPYWSQFTDFARFPHLLRFGSVADLLDAFTPGTTDWIGISAAMRRFNEETLVRSAAQWASSIIGVLVGKSDEIAQR